LDDLIQEFLAESNENLDRMDSELVKLEHQPGSAELLASIFRSIHSIKGACGFLGFNKLQALAHAGENLLSKLRDGSLRLTPEISTALLATGDGIRQMLGAIAATGQDGEESFTELIEELKRLQGTASSEAPAAAAAPPAPAPQPVPAVPALAAAASAAPQAGDKSAKDNSKTRKKAMADKPPASAMKSQPAEVEANKPAAKAGEACHEAQSRSAAEDPARPEASQDSTIRVNVGLLDRLMNLVGELVLARNQILQSAVEQEDTAFLGAIQQLNLVTTELREGVMKTRMQPISRLFDKVPRVVRDVSVACGKQVRIETEGKDTELDRTLLEAINDPLTHLVRNAIDHGVELPARRVELGKGAEGLLTLRALHEGGQVTIEISDDGAGIDVERIRKKAVECGAISADQAARMGETESLHLIFLPGVSTAEKVTNVSGRGVGMDVVKTNIERVGGSVEIQTRPGQGTTFRVKVPLTLAIVPALIVRSSGKCFAIPQVNLVELVRLERERGGIEMVHGTPVYRLRGKLLPLVDLNQELGLASEAKAGAVNIVVLQVDSRRFGLVVDAVHDAEEIVVKPLSKHFKGIRAYAGATIMGDGKLALILDVLGLASAAGIGVEAREHAGKSEVHAAQEAAGEKQKYVLFAGPGDSRMALPLGSLARLEELPASKIERSGKCWVAQYRGKILPLVQVSQVLPQEGEAGGLAAPASGTLPVLVLSHDGQTFGLIVDRILDIVEPATAVRMPATRAGVLYSAVIADRVTELLDIPAIWRAGEIGAAAGQSCAEASE
jgi:two-component system, chemotaxis family, sensor kinase CheA